MTVEVGRGNREEEAVVGLVFHALLNAPDATRKLRKGTIPKAVGRLCENKRKSLTGLCLGTGGTSKGGRPYLADRDGGKDVE